MVVSLALKAKGQSELDSAIMLLHVSRLIKTLRLGMAAATGANHVQVSVLTLVPEYATTWDHVLHTVVLIFPMTHAMSHVALVHASNLTIVTQ